MELCHHSDIDTIDIDVSSAAALELFMKDDDNKVDELSFDHSFTGNIICLLCLCDNNEEVISVGGL